MREKIEIGDCVLYLGDCSEIVPKQKITDYNLVTDPPYGINENSKKVASRGSLAPPTNYGEFDWDKEKISKEIIDLLRENSKHQIIFGGNYYKLPPTSCWLVWDKQNGKSDFADCELAWTNLQKAVRLIQWQWRGFIRKGEQDKTINFKRCHPTQKPVGVMEWCLNHLPDDGRIILDPFMGSGTTGVACVKTGRKFIGIEQNPEYFEIACERIKEAYKQPDFFVTPHNKATQDSML
jgi:site-specific DNA-methyltransferase (adenine-specific)/modification methylase